MIFVAAPPLPHISLWSVWSNQVEELYLQSPCGYTGD